MIIIINVKHKLFIVDTVNNNLFIFLFHFIPVDLLEMLHTGSLTRSN